MDTAIAAYSHQSKAGRYRQCYSTVNSTVGAHLVQLKILVHVVRQSPYAAHAYCICWSHSPDLLDLVGSLEVCAVVGETVLHHHVVAGAPVFSVHN